MKKLKSLPIEVTHSLIRVDLLVHSLTHSLTHSLGGNTFNAIEQENSRFIDEQQHTTHNILLQQDLELTNLGTHFRTYFIYSLTHLIT